MERQFEIYLQRDQALKVRSYLEESLDDAEFTPEGLQVGSVKLEILTGGSFRAFPDDNLPEWSAAPAVTRTSGYDPTKVQTKLMAVSDDTEQAMDIYEKLVEFTVEYTVPAQFVAPSTVRNKHN